MDFTVFLNEKAIIFAVLYLMNLTWIMTNGLTKTLFGSILSVVFIYLKKSYQTIQILSNSKKTVKDSF